MDGGHVASHSDLQLLQLDNAGGAVAVDCLDVSALHGLHHKVVEMAHFPSHSLTAEETMLSALEHRQQRLIDALTKALDANGYLHISSKAIEQALISEVITTSREFFQSDDESKLLAISKDKARRGYCPINTENFASLIGQSAPNDIVEKFRIGPLITSEGKESDAAYYGTKSGRIYFYENSWGGTSSTFQHSIETLYLALTEIALDLLCALAVGIHLPPTYFINKMHRHTSIMSVNGYSNRHLPRRVDVVDEEAIIQPIRRVHEHTDVSLLTLVMQSAPGLQIKNKSSNEWETIPCLYGGSLFVHVGDCLQHWSRGRFVSTLHQVVMDSSSPPGGSNGTVDRYEDNLQDDEDRVSIAYFTTPDYDALLDWPLLPKDALPTPRSATSSSLSSLTHLADHELDMEGITANSAKDTGEVGKDRKNKNKKKMSSKLPKQDLEGVQEDITFDVWRKRKIAQSIACTKSNK
jgi:isopenicillin N synthase-like dioxygenase